MSERVIENAAAFLREPGDLHDVRFVNVTYGAQGNRLEIEVDDLNWNFERLSGHVTRPVSLIFTGISAFAIVAGQDKFHTSLVNEGVVVAHAYAITKNSTSRMDFVMSTSEQWYVEYENLTVRDKEAA